MTPIEVRPARAEDKNAVVAFCQNTFSWGDYIPEVYDTWLADARGTLLVALIDHQPVGLLHAEFLDRGVAWLSGMRVHPDFRRQGVGSAADAVARSLGRARGCRVARLATNIKNIPAQQILAKEGYTCIVRFNEWEAKPARRAFSAARVAKPDHAPAILDAWRAWATREPNPALLVDRNWRWLELNEARLRDQIDAGEVR
ncbi:MAG: GNAT family N-acetyltransferase, partial [Chloroflexota bacterium]|nr:GNAT family N-acetyltransferase [Chloroflexota bacterium]